MDSEPQQGPESQQRRPLRDQGASFSYCSSYMPNIYEENGDGGMNQLPKKGSDAAGPSRPGTDCQPIMPVPPRVVKKVGTE